MVSELIKKGTYFQIQVTSNLVFYCKGEFSECNLKERRLQKYLSYDHNWITTDKICLKDDYDE